MYNDLLLEGNFTDNYQKSYYGTVLYVNNPHDSNITLKGTFKNNTGSFSDGVARINGGTANNVLLKGDFSQCKKCHW